MSDSPAALCNGQRRSKGAGLLWGAFLNFVMITWKLQRKKEEEGSRRNRMESNKRDQKMRANSMFWYFRWRCHQQCMKKHKDGLILQISPAVVQLFHGLVKGQCFLAGQVDPATAAAAAAADPKPVCKAVFGWPWSTRLLHFAFANEQASQTSQTDFKLSLVAACHRSGFKVGTEKSSGD